MNEVAKVLLKIVIEMLKLKPIKVGDDEYYVIVVKKGEFE